MKILSAVTAVTLFCGSVATAAPISFDFTQSGFSGGGIVTGSFLAEDLDGNGQISSFDGEVVDFSMSFAGDTGVADFSLSFADLFGLVYDIGSGLIGDGTSLDIEGIGAEGAIFSYVVGPGPLALCDGSTICGIVTQSLGSVDLTSETILGAVVNDPSAPVPLPGAMALFAGAAAFGSRLVKRRRSA